MNDYLTTFSITLFSDEAICIIIGIGNLVLRLIRVQAFNIFETFLSAFKFCFI